MANTSTAIRKGTLVYNAKALTMADSKTYAAGTLIGVVEHSRWLEGQVSYLVTWATSGIPVLRNTLSGDRKLTRWASASWVTAR